MMVDISDALSEKEKVKFTVHTKTTLPEFRNAEFTVVRQHEEFVWLHDRYEENEDYAGYIVDISDALSEKEKVKFTVHTKTTLPEFRNAEFTVVRQHEEFVWLHDRYEENEDYAGEYLATFKKTVAMHEVFLQRLAAHPVFRHDTHLRETTFLQEYYSHLKEAVAKVDRMTSKHK
ncbi:Sorting nexin, partial [Operophtera brumata]